MSGFSASGKSILTTSCGGAFFYSHNAQTEMLQTMLATAALACFYKGTTFTDCRRKYLACFNSRQKEYVIFDDLDDL